MRRLEGPTYHIRKELRALGGAYDCGVWYVPEDRYDEAMGWLEIGLARRNASRGRTGR